MVTNKQIKIWNNNIWNERGRVRSGILFWSSYFEITLWKPVFNVVSQPIVLDGGKHTVYKGSYWQKNYLLHHESTFKEQGEVNLNYCVWPSTVKTLHKTGVDTKQSCLTTKHGNKSTFSHNITPWSEKQ